MACYIIAFVSYNYIPKLKVNVYVYVKNKITAMGRLKYFILYIYFLIGLRIDMTTILIFIVPYFWIISIMTAYTIIYVLNFSWRQKYPIIFLRTAHFMLKIHITETCSFHPYRLLANEPRITRRITLVSKFYVHNI